MTFDLTKFYQARVSGSQLRGLFATLRKLGEHAKREGRRTLLLRIGGAVAVLALLFLTSKLVPQVGIAAIALSVVGLAFVVVTWAVHKVVVHRAPNDIPSGLFMLIFLGGPLGAFAWVFSEEARELLVAPRVAVPAAIIATAGVVYLSLATAGVSWKGIEPQAVELDYLERILMPLYADLPKSARADLVFNPFRGEWSRITMPTPKRSGYTFEGTADIILRMRMPLDEHRDVKLSIIEQALTKTKNRKGKYKGTKRRLVVRYDMQLAPGAEHDARLAVETALANPSLLPSRVVVDKQRLTVVQVKKSADLERDLKPAHLVPAAQVLRTIRAMSDASIARPATPSP